MMNDMMPTIEETITPDITAQLEFAEWQRQEEEGERWKALEAIHGPLASLPLDFTPPQLFPTFSEWRKRKL